MSFNQRFKKAIQDSKWSHLSNKELAELLGVTMGYVSNLKGPKDMNPSRKVTERIAEVLEVSPAWLDYGVEEGVAEPDRYLDVSKIRVEDLILLKALKDRMER